MQFKNINKFTTYWCYWKTQDMPVMKETTGRYCIFWILLLINMALICCLCTVFQEKWWHFRFWITQSKMNQFLFFLERRILVTWMIINLYTTLQKSHHPTLWNADLFCLIEVCLGLPNRKRWQYCNFSFVQQHFQFASLQYQWYVN